MDKSYAAVCLYRANQIEKEKTKVSTVVRFRWCSSFLYVVSHHFCFGSFYCIGSNSDNHDDVRDEWERILLSYEILSDKKSRQRYNRHEFVADPGAAMQRAAMGAAPSGVTNIGKGIFSIGASALNLIIGDNDQNNKDKNNNVE
jgi:hypothetical protein